MKKHSLWILLALVMLPSLLFPQTPEQMARLFEYFGKSDFKAIIALSHEILKSEPENNFIMYTLAWAYAKENDVESSVAWIEKSIRAGNTDYLNFERDPDFKPVLDHPKFPSLMELGRHEAMKEQQRKTIRLQEGEWTSFALGNNQELPQIQISLSFDPENFYIKAAVKDAHFKDGDRSWRYGDGFLINFVTPADFDNPYSDLFHAFGFSLQGGKPIAVLVNKDGTYYLRPEKELTPQIEVNKEKMEAHYSVTIPWSALYPFHSLMDERAGINIIYTSQHDNGTPKWVKYIEDNQYDSEMTKFRRYAPLDFKPSAKSALSLAGRLAARLASSERTVLKLAVWAPAAAKVDFYVTIKDKDLKTVAEEKFSQELPKGRSLIEKEIMLPEPEGAYGITVTLGDRIQWKESYFKYDPASLAAIRSGVQELSKKKAGLILSNSLDALTYRLTELEKQIKGFTARHRPEVIQNNLEEMNSLYAICWDSGSIYGRSGYLLSAFKSPLDATLQPFSIYLPEYFDPAKSYVLQVALHGSGVDEVGFLRWTAQKYSDSQTIIIGPRGRSLSDSYTGDTEKDVIDLVQLIRNMFRIKRTIVQGFSMGGYGVWRMSFLHPELFDAAICVSGSPSTWMGDPQQTDMRNHVGKGKNLKYLVIHGTADNAVSIKDTDEFVGKLKAAGYDVEYIRVEGGGHGNFSEKDIVTKWLQEKFAR